MRWTMTLNKGESNSIDLRFTKFPFKKRNFIYARLDCVQFNTYGCKKEVRFIKSNLNKQLYPPLPYNITSQPQHTPLPTKVRTREKSLR